MEAAAVLLPGAGRLRAVNNSGCDGTVTPTLPIRRAGT
jgi:hypothetical protein